MLRRVSFFYRWREGGYQPVNPFCRRATTDCCQMSSNPDEHISPVSRRIDRIVVLSTKSPHAGRQLCVRGDMQSTNEIADKFLSTAARDYRFIGDEPRRASATRRKYSCEFRRLVLSAIRCVAASSLVGYWHVLSCRSCGLFDPRCT